MNPNESIREHQKLFEKKPGSVRGRMRVPIVFWGSLLMLVIFLTLPGASFAQSGLTGDANVNCSDHDDDDDDYRHQSASTNTGGVGSNCGGKTVACLSIEFVTADLPAKEAAKMT